MEPTPAYWHNRRVGVTGGTGLLGYQIVKRLVRFGARVRLLVLPPPKGHPIVDQRDVACHFGDVRDAEFVRHVLAGCDVVFHTAGVVAVWGPKRALMRSVNVDGTRLVLECAPEAARIVHTSSVVTVGASHGTDVLDEESPFDLARLKIDYVHAKRDSESLAFEAGARGRDVIVTNPGYMVGPEDYHRSVMGRFCKRFWKGRIPFAPPGGLNLVDVRDVAAAHLLAAEHGQPCRRYILGGENRSFSEFLALLAEAGGMSPRALPRVPWWTLASMAVLSEARSRFLKKEPYPSFQHVLLNRRQWFYTSARAEAELGYRSRPLLATLADTYRWYLSRGEIPVLGLNRWWLRPVASLDRAA
jgi:dihydroflavonol-4-reductase